MLELEALKNSLMETSIEDVESELKKYDRPQLRKLQRGLWAMKESSDNPQELEYLERVEDVVESVYTTQTLNQQ